VDADTLVILLLYIAQAYATKAYKLGVHCQASANLYGMTAPALLTMHIAAPCTGAMLKVVVVRVGNHAMHMGASR
jgi:hypothetical protein